MWYSTVGVVGGRISSPGERLVMQMQNIETQINQLKLEVDLPRIKVSQACFDLINYCECHAKNDFLLPKNTSRQNPFHQKRNYCIII